MKKKYKITKETVEVDGHTLHRIMALKELHYVENVKSSCIIATVTKGILGGFIESEENLSQDGDCWVDDNAKVYGDAKVYGNTQIFGNTEICGNAEVSDIGDYMVFRNSWSSGRYFTWTKSNDMWRVGCFYGTGEELIKKAYIDSKLSGKMYEKYVNFVKELNTNV